MRGYGEHLQLSVFRCELSRRELIELRDKLGEIIHHGQDQVLFANLGKIEGRASRCISALGRPYVGSKRHVTVI
jgi:CRISPR-associated protein Cas2